MAATIWIGADAEAASVTLTEKDGSDMNWAAYSSVELYIQNRYRKTIAKYKYPTTAGFRPLTLPQPGAAVINLFKEDTAKLYPGVVYATVKLFKGHVSYPEDYQPDVRKIIIGNAER